MEEKKSNRGLIIAIVILSICVLALVGYIVYDKVIKKEPAKISCSDCVKSITNIGTTEKIEKNVIFNNKIQKLVYESKEENIIISLDGKEFYNNHPEDNITGIYVFNEDTIIVTTTNGMGFGGDSIFAYDKDLKETMSLSSVENEDMEIRSITVGENKITFTASRINPSEALEDMRYNGKFINLCDDNNEFIGQQYSNVVAEAEYEITYSGNGKFSLPKQSKVISYVNESVCK